MPKIILKLLWDLLLIAIIIIGCIYGMQYLEDRKNHTAIYCVSGQQILENMKGGMVVLLTPDGKPKSCDPWKMSSTPNFGK